MTTMRVLPILSIVALLASSPSLGGSRVQFFLEEGSEFYRAGRYEDALRQFEQLLELEPTNWSANYMTAMSYLALYHPGSEAFEDKGYAEKGVAAFERTLALASPSPEVREKTEKFYLSFLDATGDRGKAIAYLEAQRAYRPTDLALLNAIAILYLKSGDFSKALEAFETRANLDPSNKEAWYTLGVNCWARSYNGSVNVTQPEREQIVEKGLMALDKALTLDPDYFDALAYINLIYREKAKTLAAVGRDVEAREAYERAGEYQERAIEIRKRQSIPKTVAPPADRGPASDDAPSGE